MIKRHRNRSFERLPSIRDTVINGDLLLTVQDRTSRKQDQSVGYEQEKETKIYKRTRLNLGKRKQMKKWPASLLLSGTKAFDVFPSPAPTITSEDEKSQDMNENSQFPPLSERVMLLEPSKSFYSDFGLRNNYSDTFSGYRDRKKKHKSYMEKELEKKAMKHIHAMQVLSNSKRGSYAIRSVNSLKETLSPVRSNTEVVLPTSYVRSENNGITTDRTCVDISKRPSYNVFVRTRDGVSKSQNNHLPEISGRTMIGLDNKLHSETP